MTPAQQREHLQVAYNALCGAIHELKAAECFHFSARADILRDDIAHYPTEGLNMIDRLLAERTPTMQEFYGFPIEENDEDEGSSAGQLPQC